MAKVTRGTDIRNRVWCFIEALLTLEPQPENFPDIKIHWEKKNTDRPELVVDTERRYLKTYTKLKPHEITTVIHLLGKHELNIWDDRRLNQNQGSEIGKFALKLWSFDKQKNHEEFKKLWELNKSSKSKGLEAIDQNNPKTAEVAKAKFDWRDICHKRLEKQQEDAKLRHKATEKGSEVNVYVPLGLVERKQQQRRGEQEQANPYALEKEVIVKTYEHDDFLQQVIGQKPAGNHKHIAIIGEPGAGKTTLLTKIASFIKDKTEDLPIFISLANLQGKTIENYLLKIWLPQAMKLVKVVVTPEIENQLIERFNKGGIWLLLDGVDEMGENSPIQALSKINNELTEWLRQARVVLTCRLNVWDTNVNNTLTGFDTYKTQEFKPEQIDDFIQQWFTCAERQQRGEELNAKLKETKYEKICKLVTNPLRLALLCQTFYLDDQGELPETKAALYQRFTRYFYEWKPEQLTELINSDDLKDELHKALSKLAFAGINSAARFRLRRSLARQQMGEKLFKLACDVGWLNLVDRLAGNDEEVYAFFHPNFQEYFAALKVNDWREFFKHIPNKPTQGVYRIFEPQWKEVILLWLGREDVKLGEKEAFIKALVEFDDQCGDWSNIHVLLHGYYKFRAYFIAAAGITEFKYSKANEIVKQILKWCFGEFDIAKYKVKFLDPIADGAKAALLQTERATAIDALVNLIADSNVDNSSKYKAASSLGKIDPGNQTAIDALVNLIADSNVDDFTKRLAVSSLGKIDPGNKTAIDTLVNLIADSNVDYSTKSEAAYSLGEIGSGNKTAIDALVKLIADSNVDNFTKRHAASSLEKIGSGNKTAIDALVNFIADSNVDNSTKCQAAYSLGEIDPGNKTAIDALVNLIADSNVDDSTKYQAAYSLGEIDPGNQTAIDALVKLIADSNVDDSTKYQAAYSLGEIDPGNKTAIDALVNLIADSNVDDSTKYQAAYSLGEIDPGNKTAIDALVKLIADSNVDDSTKYQAAYSLGEIGSGNQTAIDALVKLIVDSNVDDDTKRDAASSLGKIGSGNKTAIDALVNFIADSNVDDSTKYQAASSLGEIDLGNKTAIDALVKLIADSNVDDDTKYQAVSSLEKIGSGNKTAIDALVNFIADSNVHYSTKYRAISSLGEIGSGNQTAIDALVKLIADSNVDNSTKREAASSLGNILTKEQMASVVTVLKNCLSAKIYKSNVDLFNKYYSLIWHCAQNLTYPDFYQALHAGENSENVDSPGETFTPQNLQAAVNSDRILSQSIRLICIDTSQFIDPNNPASKIYTEIVKAGCPKSEDGTPTTMTELQTYWDLLESDKPVFLVFYQGMGSQSPQLSDRILNNLSKFDKAICVISDQGIDDILNRLRSL
ncbi:putative NTPase (NACHT family) [Cylindrospermum stagnale PCC 7417]|uniref:Putative NTPase (NACHT family) n=1 Tax=Cylindrospermum stagnale PCC 7417 TaxID=56107 RepID=K9X5L3_9NOST|nr:HEAT repeat domain-containing protein [Cylindrospermum stagnale]AFZ27768.1 putative NTPase (NACHT family) [Cylindrospermum stagnale PCC 7417]